MMMAGMPETLELCRQHQVDNADGEQEGEVQCAAHLAELARLAVVVDLRFLGQLGAHHIVEEVEGGTQRVVFRQSGRDRD
jgi:hypothetical protein